MKRSVFMIAFALLTAVLAAQPVFNLGIKGGLTSSELRFSQLDGMDQSGNLSYHAGAFSRIGIGRFYLQPEAYFNSRGGTLKEIFGGSPTETASNFDFTSVDVPVLAGIKLFKGESFNVRAMGGPVFGFITDKNVEGSPQFNEQYFNDHFYGWQVGLGFDLWFLTFDARMENSRNSVYQSSDFSTRNRVYLVSVGIKFL